MMDNSYYNSFADRLDRSKEAQKIVMDYICSLGIPCTINPAIMVPRGGDPNQYKDNGDLWMQMRAEVKHNPNSYWQGCNSYPTANIIICNAKVYDELPFQPKFFYIVNGPMTHAAIIDVARTKELWVKAETVDPYRGHKYVTYQIGKQHPAFVKIRDKPKGTLVF